MRLKHPGMEKKFLKKLNLVTSQCPKHFGWLFNLIYFRSKGYHFKELYLNDFTRNSSNDQIEKVLLIFVLNINLLLILYIIVRIITCIIDLTNFGKISA